jgi:hypothetical protein
MVKLSLSASEAATLAWMLHRYQDDAPQYEHVVNEVSRQMWDQFVPKARPWHLRKLRGQIA